jgi:glucose-1-phosphate adenylyltransferase
MGVYVFSVGLLDTLLRADAKSATSQHDFGIDVLPAAVELRRVMAYHFRGVGSDDRPYWRDIRSVDAYYSANMELVAVQPELNLYDQRWPIWTYQAQQPPAKFVLDEYGRTGLAINSMVAGGCIISGASVSYSLLSSDVRVEENSVIHRSVIMPGVTIGRFCDIRNCILDEECVIPDGTTIGRDRRSDERRFFVTSNGVVLVTRDMLAASR